MPQHKYWSKEKTESLSKDYQNKFSYDQLARKYGVSIASIRSQLYTMRKKGLIGKRQ